MFKFSETMKASTTASISFLPREMKLFDLAFLPRKTHIRLFNSKKCQYMVNRLT